MIPTPTLGSPFDLAGRNTYPIALLENLVAAGGESVDADEIVFGFWVGDLFFKELLDGGAGFDFQVVGEAGSVVVYY